MRTFTNNISIKVVLFHVNDYEMKSSVICPAYTTSSQILFIRFHLIE